ncbi:alpha/beta fold hydrolase [Phytomonospora endophytica]|uniref:Pimeloyl-ACP methyl ester carboxylesterase n=1 Tax=Phytomonospora endophytica TaxID=714109 RepID=A0A841FNA7_9ACTN|nr:alpha/beta hydrolase [Phytomonospora endophytica]MBB6037525.1 pimeloyl-ACP methyl ester carboxylesterase [Phytomonospora endophytica]GIG70777.1 alpha/beta hydrolase [Phytomonospora endophytica]
MAETRTVPAPGGLQFHCRIWGPDDGVPVLLLHGVTGSGAAWERVADALGPRWRIYAPDMRGHGASSRPGDYSFEAMRDDVLALMDALGVPEAVLVGHSMGGIAAYLLAAARPERVSGLVLVETPPPVPLGRPAPVRPEGELDYDWELRPQIIAQLNAPSEAWWKGLSAITAQTLVVSGGDQSFLPGERVLEMTAEIPWGLLTEIPVGHDVVAAAPERLAAAIGDLF